MAPPLNGEDDLPDSPASTRPGSPCPDAPIGDGYLLSALGGAFCLLTINISMGSAVENVRIVEVNNEDVTPEFRERYLGDHESAVYLIRPDQHVAARWPALDIGRVERAMQRAMGH